MRVVGLGDGLKGRFLVRVSRRKAVVRKPVGTKVGSFLLKKRIDICADECDTYSSCDIVTVPYLH